MIRICLTTYYDKEFEPLGKLCEVTMYKYASIFGLDVRTFHDIYIDRPASFVKLLCIKFLLDEGYDYVFWVDADTLFWRYDKDIRDEFEEGKELYLIMHFPETYQIPSTGVMIVKNSKFVYTLLEEMWKETRYDNHPWWEQAVLVDKLGIFEAFKHCGTWDGRFNLINRNLYARIKFMDIMWNSLLPPRDCVSPNPIIAHYSFPGCSTQYRIDRMFKDFRKIQEVKR